MNAVTVKRTHISKSKSIKVRPVAEAQQVDFKPKGFWYSVDGDWERWCKSESPDWLEGANTHAVELGRERILYLRSVDDLDEFHKKYKPVNVEKSLENYIDWAAVASEYDGIEIAPYQRKRRLNGPAHRWCYGWDCASGCIWRPNGVIVSLSV